MNHYQWDCRRLSLWSWQIACHPTRAHMKISTFTGKQTSVNICVAISGLYLVNTSICMPVTAYSYFDEYFVHITDWKFRRPFLLVNSFLHKPKLHFFMASNCICKLLQFYSAKQSKSTCTQNATRLRCIPSVQRFLSLFYALGFICNRFASSSISVCSLLLIFRPIRRCRDIQLSAYKRWKCIVENRI